MKPILLEAFFDALERFSRALPVIDSNTHLFQIRSNSHNNINFPGGEKLEDYILQHCLDIAHLNFPHFPQHCVHVVCRQTSHNMAYKTGLSSTGKSLLLISKRDNDAADCSFEHERVERNCPVNVLRNNPLTRLKCPVCVRRSV